MRGDQVDLSHNQDQSELHIRSGGTYACTNGVEPQHASSVAPWRITRLAGRYAVITGASGGIGRALAIALAAEGARLCVVGRNPVALDETVSMARKFSTVVGVSIDFAVRDDPAPVLEHLEERGRLDILIHCAGTMRSDCMEGARIEDFDTQYAVNVRAPYLLTKQLLPLLTSARGQIVFINSSAGLAGRYPDLGQYSATKHALRAIADSLREEVNPKGIRVLSVYPGRTATPMQEARYREEGRAYRPELLLQPEDVATVVVSALLLPPTAEVTDISIRPMRKV